eukprot:jgi/Mesvir1/15448/Mv06630-RA.3
MAKEEMLQGLRAHLSQIRVPTHSTKICKEECCLSFDTPKSEGGLYVDLTSFLAFGKEFVTLNYEKTGHAVYLHINKTRKKPEEEDPPRKKATTHLSLAADGGLQIPDPEAQWEETHSVVLLPSFTVFPYPDPDLPELLLSSVQAVLSSTSAERAAQTSAWVAEKRSVSIHAADLPQLDNGVIVPGAGWQCARCDKRENLWMNLTCGTVLCGRRNFDGSGGNNHALEYYKETGFPLAVKLGTINPDLSTADVFSYAEDDSVEDPLLPQHLAHFGIDFSSLKKTEMTTAEQELDQNLNFDFNRIQEKGKALVPVFGPGHTGMRNLGNSCYLASVMQAVFCTHEFVDRYYKATSPAKEFQAIADPLQVQQDFYVQLVKLAHGVLSGKYAVPGDPPLDQPPVTEAEAPLQQFQDGIPPRQFKQVIGLGHPEFATARQQDVLEFFQHLLDMVHRQERARGQNHSGGSAASRTASDPSRCFQYVAEERIQCSASGAVKYTRRTDNVLSLTIPLDAASNLAEVAAWEESKKEKEGRGEKVATDDLVRPRVPLSACLEATTAAEEIGDFYSSAVKRKTTATKTLRLATFPNYLMLHMRKFMLDRGWVPRKLDVYVDVPDKIDLSHLRGTGLQPGETELPDEEPPDEEEVAAPAATSGPPPAALSEAEMAESLDTLAAMGFDRQQAIKALNATGNNLERAADWIFSHANELDAMELDNAGGGAGGATRDGSSGAAEAKPDLPDGPGRYQLIGIISHMGNSTQTGHYVFHAKKDGRWVIFNDEKVAISDNPPKDLGYMYLFARDQE